MKSTRARKILRIATFLAVSTGLAVGTSAAAAPPAEHAQAPQEMAETHDMPAEAQEETEAVEVEEIDYPGDIDDFAEFLEEHRQEGIDDVGEYTQEGAEHMADALEEVLPREGRIFRAEPEAYQELQDRHDAWTDRIDELDDTEQAEYSQLVRDVLGDGAELLTSVQETTYPGVSQQVTEVNTALEAIDPDVEIGEQGEHIQTFFEASLTAIQDMYVAMEEEDPLAEVRQSPPIAQDGGLFDWGDDDIPSGVEDFNEFVEEHLEDGVPHVADYTREGARHYHDALQEFVTEDQELLQERLDEFSENVDALDETPRAEYPQTLIDTLDEGTQILLVIQQSYYDGHDEQVRQVIDAIDQISPNINIEAQVDTIQNAFAHAARTLRSMALDTEPPPAADAGKVDIVLAGGEEAGDEHEMALSQEVQRYADFVDGLDEDQLTGEEGQQNVVDGLRHFDEALGAILEDQPIEAARYDDAEGEPGMEMDHEEAAELNEKHEEFSSRIGELEEAIGEEEYSQHLSETVDMAAELLTSVQMENFPGNDEWSQRVRNAADEIEADVELDDQISEVMNFFTTSSEVLQEMDTETEAPVALLF